MGLIGDAFRAIVGRHADHWLASRIFETLDSAQSNAYRLRHDRLTMWGSIENLKRNGYSPGAIVDVGASTGQWSRAVARIFDEAPIYMIEANPDLETFLSAAKSSLARRGTDYSIALLGPEARASQSFYVTAFDTGSSVLPELTSFEQREITLPMRTLDDTVSDFAPGARGCLLKLDVQGYEYEVLQGARQTLERTEVVLAELSLLQYNEGAKLAAEVIALLDSHGFALYDICSILRRESDRAAFQVDAMFVRTDSQLRSKRHFWDAELWPAEKLAESRNTMHAARASLG